MRMTTRTVWVSDDGREFDNDQDCRAHEQQYAIVSWLNEDPEMLLDERSCEEIVRSLLKRFDITERTS